MMKLTRRQQEIYTYLQQHADDFSHPPTLGELCQALGLASRGSLHKQIQALIEAGLVEPMDGQQRGIRLVEQEEREAGLPFLGTIAAGRPIEAVPQLETMQIPESLRSDKPCYVLQVQGESMIELGILDGDYAIIEQCDSAPNGAIVVALVNNEEVTLKTIEQKKGKVILYPANAEMGPMSYAPDQVQIQGVLIGQFRKYV